MWLNSKRFKMPLVELFLRLDRTSHVTPFLQKLHWLPITYSILFKYLRNYFQGHQILPTQILIILDQTSRLTCGNWLSLPSVCPRKAIGRRGFAVASPTEWNRLTQSVRSQHTITGFRRQLKTYLFRLAYPPPNHISPVGANLDLNLIHPWFFLF